MFWDVEKTKNWRFVILGIGAIALCIILIFAIGWDETKANSAACVLILVILIIGSLCLLIGIILITMDRQTWSEKAKRELHNQIKIQKREIGKMEKNEAAIEDKKTSSRARKKKPKT